MTIKRAAISVQWTMHYNQVRDHHTHCAGPRTRAADRKPMFPCSAACTRMR